MAIYALTDASIVINSVDLSDHIEKVTLAPSAAELSSTAFGDTWTEITGGLKSFAVSLDFHQDEAASEVTDTLWSLLGTNTTIVIKPTSAAVSSTNPSYTGSVFIGDLKILDGSVGDLSKQSVSWNGSGALTRATS